MDESRKLEAAEGLKDGLDVTVGEGAFDDEEFIGVNERDVLEDEAEKLDLILRPVGDVGDGAFADAFALAPAFAQEDGRAGITVGADVDIHGNTYVPIQTPFCNEINDLDRF